MGKITDLWVKFQNRMNAGRQQIDFFKAMLHIETAALLLLVIDRYFPEYHDLAINYAVPVILLYAAGNYILGHYLDKKFKLFHSQNKFSNERNELYDIVKDIDERIRRIEYKVS